MRRRWDDGHPFAHMSLEVGEPFPAKTCDNFKNGNRGQQRLALLLRPALVCGLVIASFRLQEGNLFIHSANPVLAVSPFPIVALPNSAAVFALQKFERRVRDEGSLKEVFEQFEYISHSSHRFSSLFMQPPPCEIRCRPAKHHNFLIAHCVDLSQFPRYFA